MSFGALRSKAHIPALLAALWLTACGGGGGDDAPPTQPQGGGSPAPAPAPAPGPAPAPAPSTQTLITGSSQAAANGSYGVTGNSTTPVVVTLPANTAVNVGDTVRVAGIGTAGWEIAQNADQLVSTRGLTVTGGAAVGSTWTALTTPAQTPANPTEWHWVASNTSGQVLLAADNSGPVYLSTNGGTTWTAMAGLPNTNWIGADITPDGRTIVAIAFGGNMYRSTDAGANWTQVTSPAVNLAGREYEAVSISDDGQRITAVIMNGEIVYTTNGGTTWASGRAATGGAAALVRAWRSVDSSADGGTLVAVTQSVAGTPGQVWVSRDAGATWTQVTVGTGDRGWYRARVSRDGSTMAIAANGVYAGDSATADDLYISRDRGATWTAATAPAGDYTGLALSADGQVIAATISDGTGGAAGSLQLSTDRGTTFRSVAVAAAGADDNFRNVAMDQSGTRLLVATGTFISTPGRLFVSTGDRTTFGNTGAIAGGGQGEAVELRYEGNGTWRVVSSTGSFTTR